MQIDDLIVEVRNSSLERIGQIRPQDLVGATFVVRFNNVGAWSITLPYNHPLGELLRLPGYGIILTGPSGEAILSGPTLSATLTQTQNNIEGNWEIEGVSDGVVLAERLAYPTPITADVAAQSAGFDIRSGAAETVIKEYIDANIGPSAPAARKISTLTIEADGVRGSTVNASARFDTLQDLSYNLAQIGGIGYILNQSGSNLAFSVFVPTDRSDLIRMDVQNRKLSSSVYSYGTARVTRAIVGGRGEAEHRVFVERSNSDSLAAEALWGRRTLGQGTIDFEEVFGALADMNYQGPITFESFSSAVVDQHLSNTLAVWRNLWEDSMDLGTHAREFMATGMENARATVGSR